MEERRTREIISSQVLEIVVRICGQIGSIPEGPPRRAAVDILTLLAKEYAEIVVLGLLKYSLPCDRDISDVWGRLSRASEGSTAVLWHVLQQLKERPRFHESPDGYAGDPAWQAPLAAARGLGEMLKSYTCTMAMQGFYPQVFVALLTHIHFLVRHPGYTEDASTENSSLSLAEHARFAVETLKHLLTKDGRHLAVLWMEKAGYWSLLCSPERHLEGILHLARALVIHAGSHVTGLLAEIIPKLCSEDEERTLTARALFAGFLCSRRTIQLLPCKTIIGKLEEWQTDPRPTVRWLSLHGLGNMALHTQKVKRLKALVLKMMEGWKAEEERTVKEAIQALGNLLRHHPKKSYLGSCYVQIAEQLRPLLRDGREGVRAAAIGLFGKLLHKLRPRHRSQMKEQILSNMVPFLLHLQETSPDVVENCEWTLARCNDLMGWKLLEQLEIMAHYDSQEALSQISRHLVQRYPDRVASFLRHTLDYMKSPMAPLRRAAAVLTGFIIYHLEASNVVSQEVLASLLGGLLGLEGDPEPSVSSAAAVSLHQVRRACRTAAPRGLLRLLGRAFCCLSRSVEEKPRFEDSPFRRKRSLEVFEDIYY
ncbi:maestro heat-like repeat-containing protein family member 6 [Paroedura picta]|uniref:maestro heat-like repeat-containing protein family member 6 n=1 Tax=Paroedura picta TaxID=143630 RepID=UPI0040566863